MPHQHRQQQIEQWLQSIWPEENVTLQPLKGDCSFRRYYRLQRQAVPSSYIVMDAPPEQEPLMPFINSSHCLLGMNLPVPNIYQQNIELGILVLDDFGQNDLYHTLNSNNADHFYKKAIDHLVTLQKSQTHLALPQFDKSQIEAEFRLFSEWFVNRHSQQAMPALDDEFSYIAEMLLNAPQVITHRDYHSKNLMVVDNDNIGILDHQDLMIGPISYDLVSLIKDCYIDWPCQQVGQWLTYFCNQKSLDKQQFTPLFEVTGVQRHLKACGIFARQAHLYDNPNYLQFIPRTLKYVVEIADRHTNLTGLARLIKKIS